MYNKKTILLYCIFFLLCMNTIAQPPVIVTSDTAIRVKVIKENKNLILPKLKSAQQLCKQLQWAWNDYLKSHPETVKEFGLDSDTATANYFSSTSIKISRNGMVSKVNQKGVNPNIGYICYKALKATLEKSTWTAG